MAVCDIADGDFIEVQNVDFGATSPAKFLANVAATAAGGRLEARLDSTTGPVVATVEIGATGGAQAWKTAAATASGATGVHNLFLVFRTAGDSSRFRFDWWQFE